MDEKFKPILGRGENYIFSHEKKPSNFSADRRPAYEEARGKLLKQVDVVKEQINNIPSNYRVEEVVVNVKMALGYTAKSYHPNNLIRQSGVKDIGSKKWEKKEIKNDKIHVKQGKNVFLRMTEQELHFLEGLLHQSTTNLSKGFIDDVRTVEEMYISNNDYLLDVFSPEWKEGRIEIVLHPFGNLDETVEEKFSELVKQNGGDTDKLKIRSYSPGPTFISAHVERPTLEEIIKFNPIRTAHPLEFRGVPEIRGGSTNFPLPDPPIDNSRSSIIVGMFDGGINPDLPLLKDYTNENHVVTTESTDDFLQHGTAVAGAILYGDLKGYPKGSQLPTPPVNVESYRVFPLSNQKDFDLYEVIDTIEEVVPKRTDIKVFNLSIGPYGPIEDDYISRFTYVIDGLSQNGERLFTVAVGNDGDMDEEESRRIQAPSDTINGLGVGSYSFDGTQRIVRAPYSCIGEGREGAKIKPDIVEFGGCESYPFQLLDLHGQSKYFASGTSFSAPIVARKAAELMGRCNLVDPLVAKALIINSAIHPEKKFDRYLGYGSVPNSIEDILGCTDKRVTVLYKQRILPKRFVRLEIPIVKDLNYKGKVDITWTIAVNVKPNPLNSEDYTTNCIEENFYPNIHEYKFRSPDNKRNWKRDVVRQEQEVEVLLNEGWTKSKYPATYSKSMYLNEQERRANFKWDTVIKKKVTIPYNKLDSPYLVLHAMDRYVEESLSDFFNYAVVITVDYKDYKGDAYSQTIKDYSKLEMASIRNRTEILVK
ncbi:S8 family peptidase [Priestia aryabhattai]|uniref:S8 family peptidase n=1 Tax=Priestia aryabhattai TaxID=412384 RepID=UPI0027E4074A|nr:S8 family peptidase [Priestia aryabhattai]MCG0050791.1 S8 family peptidase [Priestia aryabhattai]